MGRSPNFMDLVHGIEDYADSEGEDVFYVINRITEHFIPEIEEMAADVFLVEETEVH